MIGAPNLQFTGQRALLAQVTWRGATAAESASDTEYLYAYIHTLHGGLQPCARRKGRVASREACTHGNACYRAYGFDWAPTPLVGTFCRRSTGRIGGWPCGPRRGRDPRVRGAVGSYRVAGSSRQQDLGALRRSLREGLCLGAADAA
eukprot:1531681-Pleurochrysis_carterae.AAC.2